MNTGVCIAGISMDINLSAVVLKKKCQIELVTTVLYLKRYKKRDK